MMKIVEKAKLSARKNDIFYSCCSVSGYIVAINHLVRECVSCVWRGLVCFSVCFWVCVGVGFVLLKKNKGKTSVV